MLNAEADAEVELAADLAYFAKVCKVLPRAGGLLDQDYYHVLLMRFGLEALAEREKLDADKARNQRRRK